MGSRRAPGSIPVPTAKIECSKGHTVARVLRLKGMDGNYVVTFGEPRFESSGRLRVTCPNCNADVQVSRARLEEAFDGAIRDDVATVTVKT